MMDYKRILKGWTDCDSTPWGLPHSVGYVGWYQSNEPPIFSISTGGHGGLYCPPHYVERLKIPEAVLACTENGNGERGWFEEDEDWMILALASPKSFLHDMRHAADLAQAITHWHPDTSPAPDKRAWKMFGGDDAQCEKWRRRVRAKAEAMDAWGAAVRVAEEHLDLAECGTLIAARDVVRNKQKELVK